MSIEKYVSPFIAQQFPSFYKEEGPNFIAFMQAYYEWMEQTNQTVGESRNLLEYADIDTTTAEFVEYFRNTYVASLPDDIVVDKRLLVKHILDLYRSKGSPRAISLLFRLVFNEDIELYIPSDYIFMPSDNKWFVPQYIEVTSDPGLNSVVGTQIRNSGGATAIVENFVTKVVNNKLVNVLELTNIRGRFKNGDKVYQSRANSSITVNNAVTVTGSLTGISIVSGGTNFEVGEYVDVVGSGVEGKARVASVTSLNTGGIQFSLLDGGSGYTVDAVVTVKPTLLLTIENTIGFFETNTSLVHATTGANGTIVFANSSFIRLIDFSNSLVFTTGGTVSSTTGSATVVTYSGGLGSGANFKVGAIKNTEIVDLNTDIIGPYESTLLDKASNTMVISVSGVVGTFTNGHTVNSSSNAALLEGTILSSNTPASAERFSNTTLGVSNLYIYKADVRQCWVTGTDAELTNANLVPGIVLVSNINSSVFQLAVSPTKITITGNANISNVTGSNITISNVTGYFVRTRTLTSNGGATGTIGTVTRLTDWGFPADSGNTNLDTPISTALTNRQLEIGTIAYLSNTSPGSSYTSKPYINVIEPDIAALNIIDSAGNIKGNDALVDSTITGGNGSIQTVEVLNSGYGYLPNESVTLLGANGKSASGASIVYTVGKGEGRWLSRKSFTSDLMKIQDSYYYQTFSYDVISSRMLESYEEMVRALVHPSGIALFGRYRMLDIYETEAASVVNSSIISS